MLDFQSLNRYSIIQEVQMFQKKSTQQKNRSYLSPETLKKYPLIQSPKFNEQKALKNQKERMRINQEKLDLFGQFNSLLSLKANKDFNSRTEKNSSQKRLSKLNSRQNQSRNPNVFEQKSQRQFSYSSKLELEAAQKKNKEAYLENLRQRNQSFHKKTNELKLQLKQISSSVSQLQLMLNEVELTHRNLQQSNPEFPELWILNEHDEREEDEYLGDEKQTNETFQSQSVKFEPLNNVRIPNNIQNQNGCDQIDKLKQIEQLQSKFRHILDKIQKRQKMKPKNYIKIGELNTIQNQLDQLNSFNSKSTFKNLKSQKKLQSNFYFEPIQQQKLQLLQKYKSERIFKA